MKKTDDFVDGDWLVLPRGDVAPHWSGLYVTMNKIGSMVLSRVTHERLGSPTCYLILFDRFRRRLALRPSVPGTRHAYPVRKYGKRGSCIIRAYRLIAEFGIRPPDTIEFLSPKLDPDQNLILDLNNIRVSPKAHSQCRAKEKTER